ncbi:hypothetical protein SAMD00019534_107070 [Acytostelium subglobosum LB1]|uniref:hypothetical protein n=1 Tax=Acytostelium subglobosum LB1 TaxID=1410327 RepID=UPI000644E28A|nr:hypothetical protein SAMD00019534_107070 [Acytostelium subglobosum LB1]GAM27531.1 hypothetical protein SAMD00019534_107070 [Acytostelium subglobosum LB1]|eukprot:XP_012749596.1 hypothetical protein SAMD00019534_107070 [Acytostelium subglobosum LB1]
MIGNRLTNQLVEVIKYTGNYTREQIERMAQKYSNSLNRHGANARIEVVLEYPKKLFRSGKFTKVGRPIIMFDPHDYDGAPVEEVDTFKSSVSAFHSFVEYFVFEIVTQ